MTGFSKYKMKPPWQLYHAQNSYTYILPLIRAMHSAKARLKRNLLAKQTIIKSILKYAGLKQKWSTNNGVIT